jgi:hypothetical protein
MNLCKCGCRQEVKSGNLYVNHHGGRGKQYPSLSKRMQINNPMKNPKISKKVSEWRKQPEIKSKYSEQMKQIMKNLGSNHPMKNPKIAKEHSKRMKGANSPNWLGGVSFFPYSPEFTDNLKRFIKDRDGNECQNPYCQHKTKRITTHHINYDKQDCSQFNLITLCNSCNSKANVNRDQWKHFYKKIIWSKYEKELL